MERLITDTIDNGTIENVHIAPIGDFMGSKADGSGQPEHITAESLNALADKMNSSDEVLCDIDHQSCRPGVEKDSKAAGWFSDFIVDPIKGLFAKLKLTKRGKELLENREYRYTSPTFLIDENGVPQDIHSISLTNTPAFKSFINPILNSEATEISNEKDIIDMNKEELVELIKATVTEMKAAENQAAEVEETKAEEAKPAENACSDEKEVKNECSEPAEETKNEEPACEECKEEEKKEEVIKEEALNSAPTPVLNAEPEWKSLKGQAFFDWCKNHKM